MDKITLLEKDKRFIVTKEMLAEIEAKGWFIANWSWPRFIGLIGHFFTKWFGHWLLAVEDLFGNGWLGAVVCVVPETLKSKSGITYVVVIFWETKEKFKYALANLMGRIAKDLNRVGVPNERYEGTYEGLLAIAGKWPDGSET